MARNPNTLPTIYPHDLRGTIGGILPEEVFYSFEPEITRIAGRHDPTNPSKDEDGIFDYFEGMNNDYNSNLHCVQTAQREFYTDVVQHGYPERDQAIADFDAAAERVVASNNISVTVGEHWDATRYAAVLGANKPRRDNIIHSLETEYRSQAEQAIEDARKKLVGDLDSLIYDILNNPSDLDALIEQLKRDAEADLWDGVAPVIPSITPTNTEQRIGKSPSEIGLTEHIHELSVLTSGPGKKVPRQAGVEHPWGLHTSARNHRRQMRHLAIMSRLEQIGQTLTVRKLFLNAEKTKSALSWIKNVAPPIQTTLIDPMVIKAIDDLNLNLGAIWTPSFISPFLKGPVEQKLKDLKLIP